MLKADIGRAFLTVRTAITTAALISALLACQGGSHRLSNETASGSRASFVPEDLLLREPIPSDFPQVLSREAKQHDLDLLLYAFETAYGGFSYLPSADRDAFIHRLAQFRENVRPGGCTEFCDELGDLLWTLPDSHFRALRLKVLCGKRRLAEERQPAVGENIGLELARSSQRDYAFQERRVRTAQIGILSIVGLHDPDDQRWLGYDEAIQGLIKYPVLVIDLRGLPGGNDHNGYRLAALLIGRTIDAGKGRRREIIRQDPGSFALRINLWRYFISQAELRKEAIADSIWKYLKEDQTSFQLAKDGKLPREKIETAEQQSFGPGETSYRGEIYVLIDAKCASSCESTLEALQLHPNVKTLGENTRGMIHFTNEGMIQLPESHLFVRMATKFNDYERFIEKVGHEPDIRVPKGQDAFEYLIEYPLSAAFPGG